MGWGHYSRAFSQGEISEEVSFDQRLEMKSTRQNIVDRGMDVSKLGYVCVLDYVCRLSYVCVLGYVCVLSYVCVLGYVCMLSSVWLFATPWAVDRQALLARAWSIIQARILE